MIYFDNGYRVLGLFGAAVRGEVWSIFHRSRLGRRVEEAVNLDDPLLRLNARRFSEEELRDAYNALNNVKERLRARLFWFSDESSLDHDAIGLMREGKYGDAAKMWERDSSAGALANAARLRHMMAMVRDIPALRGNASQSVEAIVDSWKTALELWGRLIERREFWDHLAAVESRGGFEPAALPDDFAELRRNAWELLLGPSAVLVAELVKGERFAEACAHLALLRQSGAPQRSVTVMESDSFAIVESQVAAACEGILANLREWVRVQNYRESSVESAYGAYRRDVYPVIKGLVEKTGAEFEPSRRVCGTAAALLGTIAEQAQENRTMSFARNLARESNAIASGTFTREIAQADDAGGGETPAAGRSARGWRALAGVKLVLLLIYGLTRLGGTSTHYSSYPGIGYSGEPIDNPYVSSSLSSSKHLLRNHRNSTGVLEQIFFDLAKTKEDSSHARALVRESRFLAEQRDTLYSMADALDLYENNVSRQSDTTGDGRRYNVEHLPDTTGSKDWRDRVLVTWLNLYGEKWDQFSREYRRYTDTLAAANKHLAALNKGIGNRDEWFDPFAVDQDLLASRDEHKRGTSILRSLRAVPRQ